MESDLKQAFLTQISQAVKDNDLETFVSLIHARGEEFKQDALTSPDWAYLVSEYLNKAEVFMNKAIELKANIERIQTARAKYPDTISMILAIYA